MALQLNTRTSNVCQQQPYVEFLPLKGFTPAVQFCQVYQAKSQISSTFGCPRGNTLCSVLSSLSKSDKSFISTVW